MLADEDLTLLVQVENVSTIILDHIVVAGRRVILKFSRFLVVANSNPLVTGEGAVPSEVPSEVGLLGREVSDKVLQSWLHDGRHHLWNAALVAELGSNDQRLRTVGRHIRDNHVATFSTTIEHVESGGSSGWLAVVVIVGVGWLLRGRPTPMNAPDVLHRLPRRLSRRISLLSFKLNRVLMFRSDGSIGGSGGMEAICQGGNQKLVSHDELVV